MALEEHTLTKRRDKKEISSRGWLVRYLILSVIGTILSFKVYLMLSLRVDLFVGLYSFITTFVLVSYFGYAYLKFKDPYPADYSYSVTTRKPLVSIIIAVKNEEDLIEKCVQSCVNSSYSNKEIIVVDDASTDNTGLILDHIQERTNILVLHLPNNVGKKKAVERGTHISKGEFFVFIDSDSTLAKDSIENAIRIFLSDPAVGAITSHIREADTVSGVGNTLQKLVDIHMDTNCRITKGAESSFASVTCCSGALSIYRRSSIEPFIRPWANDKFLGREFRFSTDRRMTAFLLGSKIPERNSDKYWKVVYSPRVRVQCVQPSSLQGYLKQQIRWRKSFIRSIFATGPIFWRRPFPVAVLYYLQMGLKILRPLIIVKALVMLPLAGDYSTTFFYFSGVIFIGMFYGIEFKLRNPTSKHWYYRPLMSLLSMFVLTWLLPFAAITIRRTSWR